MTKRVPRPTKEELLQAKNRTVPDVIGPDLKVLFCGINPSLYTGVVGYHFARPGNRFWPALHAAGITPRLFSPAEVDELLELGYGITNLVARATATAAELSAEELREGGRILEEKIRLYRPRTLAVLGITAYREAFGHRDAVLGPQPTSIGGAPVRVLPNPSGLNAHYQLPDLARLFAELGEQRTGNRE